MDNKLFTKKNATTWSSQTDKKKKISSKFCLIWERRQSFSYEKKLTEYLYMIN